MNIQTDQQVNKVTSCPHKLGIVATIETQTDRSTLAAQGLSFSRAVSNSDPSEDRK